MAIATMKDLVRNKSVSLFNSSQLSTAAGSTDGFPGTLMAASSYVTVPIFNDDKVGILVSWGASAAHSAGGAGGPTLTVAAGSGWRSDLGAFSLNILSDSTAHLTKQYILGPFESAQFQSIASNTSQANAVGDPYLSITMTTSTELTGNSNNVYICPFKFPVVEYTT